MSQVKLCSSCRKEKDVSEFALSRSSKDGLQYQCKECNKAYRKTSFTKPLKEVQVVKDLSSFTPRQLIDELRSRGYTGELQYTQKIKV